MRLSVEKLRSLETLRRRKQIAYGERASNTFGTPMWIPYGFIPLVFSVLGLQFLLILPHGARTDDKLTGAGDVL